MAPAGNLMLGMSRTMCGGKAVAFEYLRVVERGEDVFYVAQPGGKPPTEFKLVRSEAGGKELVAVVSGGGNGKVGRLEFRFRKIDESSH